MTSMSQNTILQIASIILCILLNNAFGSDDDQSVLIARHIVNRADWAAVATISTREDVPNFPVANLISIADGAVGNGTGIPYMYLTPLDFTAQDIAKDNRATLLISKAQGDYCKKKELDPMDPSCARVVLSGRILTLENPSTELTSASKSFFARHPKLINMPEDHEFFWAKLEIVAIVLYRKVGGPEYISVNDYFGTSVY